MKLYIYKVIRESLDGKQGKRTRLYYTSDPLRVGGLYPHLGEGFPGIYRVLELKSSEDLDS